MDEFPRLLVATEFPPNASGGGPAVVRQLLKPWPVDRLLWWSCFADVNERFGQRTAAHRVATLPSRLYPNRRWLAIRSWMMSALWTPWAAWHFKSVLRTLQPDVVWVIPHFWSVPPLARVLPGGRIGFHTTVQDYIDSNTNLFRFGAERGGTMARSAERLYREATTRDATSHPMIADLRARTGCEAAQMLHAGLEAEDFTYLTGRSERGQKEICIAYAGTIVVEDDFARFAGALRQARLKAGLPVTLEFFGAHSYRSRSWFDGSWMRERGNLSEPALLQALKECAWGFAPMSFRDDDPRYNRFSFPTKFISYLAAGLPVISMGHPESSVMKMSEAYQVGVRLTAEEPERMTAELVTALQIREPWARFGAEIVRCARTEFDADRMRRVLYDCFSTCVSRTRR